MPFKQTHISISAVLALLVTGGTFGTLFYLGAWKGMVKEALELAAPMLLLTNTVIDRYFQKHKEDAERGLTKSAGNGKTAL